MAGPFADRYCEEFLLHHARRILKHEDLTLATLIDHLGDPVASLHLFFGHYAFGRRGKDREPLSRAAVRAVNLALSESDGVDGLLSQPDGVAVWNAFVKVADEDKFKPNEQQNRGILQGIIELAQEIYQSDDGSSLADWILAEIEETGRLEPAFERIVDIRGVGPKGTSTFLRDLIVAAGLEQQIEPSERIHVQPVDRWIRSIAKLVVDEPGMDSAADWIIAGKVSKYARLARVSGLRFNMGTTYFGQKVVREPDRFEAEVAALVAG